MSLVTQLSSQVGDRTEEANRAAAERCLEHPELLGEIAEPLAGKDAALIGDCAEVMTKVAERRPALVVPYFAQLTELLSHKTTRVRWEAMHALALIAELAPERAAALLPRLEQLIRKDPSTIVRDYAIDALGQTAKAGADLAQRSYPLLREALTAWEGKHAGRALNGLREVVGQAPRLALEAMQIGHDYAEHAKPTVRKAAKALVKAAERA
ncbi:hypothetical protein FE784_16240 [Paenibacillus hemerocallicola]|uniref:HEAT repeat domain-containing protein n=1 Tax=Paenibacillus hemerocallicola TaxID=1172614 RepID=A0A5C4T9T1_9BACL|nr:HEAT repeat domain-containing protein [Paenibacillus hemerocallicola]TNJ65149.1 hypothetical protein FE784_16240 [Paenibacillus hemerocallicola]